MDGWRSEISSAHKTGGEFRTQFIHGLLEDVNELPRFCYGHRLLSRCRDSLRSDIFGGDGKNNSTATDDVFKEDPFLDENGEASDKRKRKAHARRSYHYMIGNYEESTFFQKYLSNELISVPGSGEKISVRQHTMQQSLKNLSSFRSWFRLPLYKVEEIADRFITNGWICQSHHCRTPGKLKIKTELLVMGSLALLAGTIQNFCQLPIVTNICATDHSKFFLLFVDCIESISSEYIYLPEDEADVESTLNRYEEVGLPGAIGSIDVVHVRWSKCPAGRVIRH